MKGSVPRARRAGENRFGLFFVPCGAPFCGKLFLVPDSGIFSIQINWNLAENSVSILFVGDGSPVPLHNSLFTVSPHPFGRFFRLLREAKRLPYALTNWNLSGRRVRYRTPGHCEPVTDVTGVAISRIEAPFLMDEFREMAGKNACMTMGCLEFDGDSH